MLVRGTAGSVTEHPVEVRLFAFHHAGGSHTLFRGWKKRLPQNWDVRPMDAPGHGKLFGQPLLDDLDQLVEHFAERIQPDLDRPYALFGHSMGGLVACALAHRLLAEGHTRPAWLGISAARVPGSQVPAVSRHLLPDEQLRDQIRQMGGTPALALDDPTMWEVFAPLIRADFKLVDTPRTGYDRTLPVPLSVFGGRADAALPPEQLAAWAGQSDDFLGLRIFDGGHFYLAEDPGPLLDQVVKDVRSALGAGPERAEPERAEPERPWPEQAEPERTGPELAEPEAHGA